MPPSKTFGDAALIAVDWGTSRLRAWLLDRGGSLLAEAASEDGIGKVAGNYEAVFARLVADWPSATPAIMAGMIGSRQGWREVPYVPCPATAADIAGGVLRFEAAARSIAIVPGLAVRKGDGDVMRGEETQIVGLIDAEPRLNGAVVHPGTHSKWVRIERGTIVDFRTFMTGELFELLSRTSFLRHSVAEGGNDIAASAEFARAVRRTAVEGEPFLVTLFPVRARQLLAGIDPRENLAYLSGLVIGGEIAAARASGRLTGDGRVRIVGSRSLARAYRAALEIAGAETVVLDGERLVVAGLMHMARSLGLSEGHRG